MHPSVITGTLALLSTLAYYQAKSKTRTLRLHTKTHPTEANKLRLKRQTITYHLIAVLASACITATFFQLRHTERPPTTISIFP